VVPVDALADGLFLVLFLASLALSLVPLFPATLLLALATLLHELLVGFSELSLWDWAIFLLLIGLALVADNLAAAWGARRHGAGRAGVWGAVLGALAGGLLLGPLGLVLGPFLGAFAFELAAGRTGQDALRAGWGGVVGFFLSVGIKLLLNAAAGAWVWTRIR